MIKHWVTSALRTIAKVGLVALGSCIVSVDPVPKISDPDTATYSELYPYYAELCAVSQLNKKPGFGAALYSGIGGHEVLYLNGVCRDQSETYPTVALCDTLHNQELSDGVGLSVNAHYQNTSWVAVDGRDFFYTGGLAPAAAVTVETYRKTQALAKLKGFLYGVEFHPVEFNDMPSDFTKGDYRYELSIATDYAIQFGRNRYCARVPLSRPQMERIVTYLNQLNEPYRHGKIFNWDLFRNNCGHVNHNALTAATIWRRWDTDRSYLVSLFDFPVPKNEFVNLIWRTNNFPIADIDAVYNDNDARNLLLHDHRLPTEPGSLAEFGPILTANAIYNTVSPIIFYDEPVFGSYEARFQAIYAEPRYYRLHDNLLYFARLYDKILAERRPVEYYFAQRNSMTFEEKTAFEQFYIQYFDYIARQKIQVSRDLSVLSSR